VKIVFMNSLLSAVGHARGCCTAFLQIVFSLSTYKRIEEKDR